MRCLVVALVLLLLGSAFAQVDPCDVQVECVGEGDECSSTDACGTSDNPCLRCEDSVCMPSKKVCVGVASVGEACSDADGPLCKDKYFDQANKCLSSKCGTSAAPLQPGDACVTNDALIENSDKTGGCSSGNCSNGVCVGLDKGENCSALTAPCKQGLYCTSILGGVCEDVKAAGSDCTLDSECEPGTVCVGTPNGKCTAVFSIAGGSSCDGAKLLPVDEDGNPASALCQPGLTCLGGKCENPDDLEGEACEADSDCTEGQPANSYKCVENPCTGEKSCQPLFVRSDKEVANAYKAYLDCLKTKKCDGAAQPWSDGTSANCAGKNCLNEWKAYKDLLPYQVGECGAASFAPLALVLAIAALFALFF